MAYQALYRKWRPLTFDDVIGQGHITNTLKNEITENRIAHAYLFTGTRGTGKTSTAKILSRAVNCETPVNGNPCNTCEVCKGILSDRILDVAEIDAASNTGVDNIRDIIEQVQYMPTQGKYKVYIIDEVHMLSAGAFNALLKTLEEPPPHVIFILATTEIQKVPATILSRCQRFDFKTISIYDIVSNIKKILTGEGITADDAALEYVAYLGDGSMRDSLSILDQCLAFKGNELTVGDVTDVVGAVDDSILYEFASDIATHDVTSALKRWNTCINSGKNTDNIIKGLLNTFREILLFKINGEDFLTGVAKRKLLQDCSDKFEVSVLVRCVNILSDLLSSMKTFSSQRVLAECALVKLAVPQVSEDNTAVSERLSALEAEIRLLKKNGVSVVNQIPIKQNQTATSEPQEIQTVTVHSAQAKTDEKQKVSAPDKAAKSGNTDAAKVVKNWQDVLKAIAAEGKLKIYTALFEAKPVDKNGTVSLMFESEDNKKLIAQPDNITYLNSVITAKLNITVELSTTMMEYAYSATGNDVFKDLGGLKKEFPKNFKIE